MKIKYVKKKLYERIENSQSVFSKKEWQKNAEKKDKLLFQIS